jgi:hypothetical protein
MLHIWRTAPTRYLGHLTATKRILPDRIIIVAFIHHILYIMHLGKCLCIINAYSL